MGKLKRGCEKGIGKEQFPFISCADCSYSYGDKDCKDFREKHGTKVVNR